MSDYRRSISLTSISRTTMNQINKTNRSGHFPGYLRDAFLEAIDGYESWEIVNEPEPTIEVGYSGELMTVSEIFRKLWNCTDIMPGNDFDYLANMDVYPKKRTYAAAARALLQAYKDAEAMRPWFPTFERAEVHEIVGYDS
jgi:hypothetical protein